MKTFTKQASGTPRIHALERSQLRLRLITIWEETELLLPFAHSYLSIPHPAILVHDLHLFLFTLSFPPLILLRIFLYSVFLLTHETMSFHFPFILSKGRLSDFLFGQVVYPV